MAPYLFIAVVYWLFAFAETNGNRRLVRLDSIGAFIFIVFAGLRFETGCDWMAYERYFHDVPTLGALASGAGGSQDFGRMEILFGLLNSIIKSFGLNFQFLLLITVLFNGLVLFSFLRRYSAYPMLCAAVYFCWSYLPLQMACVRHSVAYSFVLLAIQALLNGKTAYYYVWIIIGCGFHAAILPFLALGPILQKRLGDMVIFGLLGTGILVYLGNVDFIYYFSIAIRKFISASIADRVDFYMLFTKTERSIESMLYLAFNFAFAMFYRHWLLKRKCEDKIDNVCLNLSIILVLMQMFFGNIPILWQRFRYIVVVAQACGFSRMLTRFSVGHRLIGYCAAIVPSALILSIYLTSVTAQVYVPYQSYATYLVTGDEGDGFQRSERFMAEYLKYYRK